MAADPSPTAALLAWYADYLPAPSPDDPGPGGTAPLGTPACSDRELVERARGARNGHVFDRLWRGDLSLHGGDHSRADAALVAHLWWWTGGDAQRTDRLFRQSGLMRPKWDEVHYGDGRRYGEATIAFSTQSVGARRPAAVPTGGRR